MAVFSYHQIRLIRLPAMGRVIFLSVPLRQIKGNRNYFSTELQAMWLKEAFVSFEPESRSKVGSKTPFCLSKARGSWQDSALQGWSPFMMAAVDLSGSSERELQLRSAHFPVSKHINQRLSTGVSSPRHTRRCLGLKKLTSSIC